MITATLDVNCINLKENKALDIIHKLGQERKIELYKTDTLDLEIIYGNPNKENKSRLAKSQTLKEDKGSFVVGHNRVGHNLVGSDKTLERLRKSSQLKEDNGVGLWGHFRWGHGKWDDGKSYIDEFKELLFLDINSMNEKKKRKALRDCIHLSTHKVYGRDFFITKDKNFFKHKEKLKKRYDIIIISPEEFIELEEIKRLTN